MSSANVEEHIAQDSQVLTLARGFDTLLEITQKLTCQERRLRSRLQFAHDEYLKLANQLSRPSNDDKSNLAEQILHGECFHNDDHNVAPDLRGWIRDVEDSGYITDSGVTAVVEGVDVYRSIAGQSGLRNGYLTSNTCLVAANAQARASMERDFTTRGISGNLQCPFAKPGEGKHTVGQVEDGQPETCGRDLDPIRAEFHCGRPPTASVSGQSTAAAAAARCPIRYLDNHSPEELAKYFENHKHEIPRSHALCIQRYQRDSQSLRVLDEKYGDLTNMVKGLGQYHQPYLPSAQSAPEGAQHDSSASVERVGKWAEDVDTGSAKGTGVRPPFDNGDPEREDGRENQFDRSLRDIRVGESPSRPWGIHVPVSGPVPPTPIPPATTDRPPKDWSQFDESSSRLPPVEHPEINEQKPTGAGRCPFHVPGAFRTDKNSNATEGIKTSRPEAQSAKAAGPGPQLSDRRTTVSNPTANRAHGESQPSAQPGIVFNGPVFFGYTPEATALLLQNLNSPPGP